MIILNFTHPLTSKQQLTIAELAGEPIDNTFSFQPHFDHGKSLESQIHDLVNNIKLTNEEWQRKQIFLNPPGWAPTAVALLTELHGRMGYFPKLIVIRPKSGPGEPYEIAEIIDLRAERTSARINRLEQ